MPDGGLKGGDGAGDTDTDADTDADTDTDTDADTDGDTDAYPPTDTGEPEVVEELCEEHAEVDVLNGEYRVHNNIWGNGPNVGEQCIAVADNSFEITHSTHLSMSEVSSYPFIL